MERTACISVVSLALLGLLASGSRAESNGPPDAQRIARLIDQLGSKKFHEREQAAGELDAAGATVLTALQKAAHHPDPEVSRRAEYLAQRIEKRLETAQILEPKRVHLRYQDTPLDEAVADFARKTGFTLEPPAGAHSQRITLDTGETTFWQALDQFCRKAGLVEHPSNPTPAMAAQAAQEMRVLNGRNGIIVNNIVISSSGRQAGYGSSVDGALRLTTGKASTCPTFYSGAVRVRALPESRSARLPPGETTFALEIMPQPKMGWQAVLDVQVEKAVDEHGQVLLPASETKDVTPETMIRQGRAIMLDSETGQVVDARKVPVRLKLGDRPARTLKEFRGVISAQIQTPVQPLITVDDVLKSAGKTVKGRDGRAVTVTEVSRDAEGTVKMRISLEEPVPANMAFNRRVFMRANRVIVRNGVVINGGIMRETGIAGESKLALVDAQGKSFGMEVNSYAMSLKNNSMVQDMQMTFQPHSGQTEPAKFVYSDHRMVNIDVPFVLKDVALSAK